jgi:hypothetical protein
MIERWSRGGRILPLAEEVSWDRLVPGFAGSPEELVKGVDVQKPTQAPATSFSSIITEG